MKELDLRNLLEEQGVENEKIDQVLEVLSQEKSVDNSSASGDIIQDLRLKIEETDDWRLKAKYAAMIISHRLKE